MKRAIRLGSAGLWIGLGVSTTALAAPPTVDGSISAVEYGAAITSQRFQTQFGDDNSGDQFGFGSELDQMFVTNDADNLYVGLTGNLQNNGNAMMLFIDVDGDASGAHLLRTRFLSAPIAGLPRFLTGDGGNSGLDHLIFDTGFAPDYLLGWSGGSPLGSQTRNYYLLNWTDLDPVSGGTNHMNTIAGLMTSGDPTASGSSGTLGTFLSSGSTGILGAADNSNVDGVEGGNGLWTVDPATATTGFEFAIPLALLGVGVDDSVCMMAMVSGDNGWMSNQFLPTDTAASTLSNLERPPYNFNEPNGMTGDQFICYTIVAGGGCPNPGCELADINGSCTVDLGDLAILLSNFGTLSGATFADGDIEPPAGPDGDVDLGDLSLMLANFGQDCN